MKRLIIICFFFTFHLFLFRFTYLLFFSTHETIKIQKKWKKLLSKRQIQHNPINEIRCFAVTRKRKVIFRTGRIVYCWKSFDWSHVTFYFLTFKLLIISFSVFLRCCNKSSLPAPSVDWRERFSDATNSGHTRWSVVFSEALLELGESVTMEAWDSSVRNIEDLVESHRAQEARTSLSGLDLNSVLSKTVGV